MSGGEPAVVSAQSPEDASVALMLHASLLEILDSTLRAARPLSAAPEIRAARTALYAADLASALRQIDRAWRCESEDRATLATIFGRLLLLDGRDYDAAAHLLRRSLELAPDPDDAALLALALLRSDHAALAREAMAAALSGFAVRANSLLFQIAGIVARHDDAVPGWIGRAPDLGLVGQLTHPDRSRLLEIRRDGREAQSCLPQPDKANARGDFSTNLASEDCHTRLYASSRGAQLLGSGLCSPENFALDGRALGDGRRLSGWVRLGWQPSRALRLRVEDENGGRAALVTRVIPGHHGRRGFELDLAGAGMHGDRLQITARLPDGRWQCLPDAPLLLSAACQFAGDIRSVESLRRRPAIGKPAPAVDVIIPVYRGRVETLRCIEAVLTTVDAETPIIVVDDASDDAALAAALDAWATAGRITLLRNALNQGFVTSVSRAMALHPTHDALLLNSDACVFGDWLPRLRAAAYSDVAVGTVTPLCNSGSIASYPRRDGMSMEVEAAAALHALAAGTAAGIAADTMHAAAAPTPYPEIPVGVGFCLYIRRDCLRDVGPFDAAVFAKGYGEETDFCLRARQRGWSNRLATDVFVYHAGGLSFGGRRAALLDRSQRLLNLRHPGYDQEIAAFYARDPLLVARRRLDLRRLATFAGQFVLVVTLALRGGVDRFVTERCRRLRASGKHPLVLKASADGARHLCELSTDALEVPNLRFAIPADLQELATALAATRIEAVEIQHFLHLDARVIEIVRALPIPYEIIVHDYAWLCPRITMIDGSGRYCGEPAVAVCERCVSSNGSQLGETLTVAELRARSELWLRGAQRVLAPSEDTAARLKRHFADLPVFVQPHSARRLPPPAHVRRSTRGPVRVALLGAIGRHKGYGVLLECAHQARLRDLNLEFIVIGYTEEDEPLLSTGKVFITGRYGEAEIPHLLRREQPDVIWLPSVWPETWCYALDHALDSGLPVAGFDIGAIAERLRGVQRGTLMPLDLDADAVNRRLLEIGGAAAASASTTKTPNTSGDIDMNNPTDAKPATPSSDESLSASVQVLPLTAGLYLFSVTTATAPSAATAGRLRLPAMHVGLGPGEPPEHVEFMSGPTTQGAWLFAATDRLVVKINAAVASMILTSVRGPTGQVLSIKVERLSALLDPTPAPATTTPTLAPAAAAPAAPAASTATPDADPTLLPVRVTLHVRARGNMTFTSEPWAGRVAPGLWLEAFAVSPLESVAAGEIEYKGLTGSGFETPWTSDDQPCGTQGMSVPLVGFALRLKATPATLAYDCEYSGYFQSGLTVGPLRNGAPCRSTVANDPLEGIQVRIVKQIAAKTTRAPARLDATTAHAAVRRSARLAPRPSHREP